MNQAEFLNCYIAFSTLNPEPSFSPQPSYAAKHTELTIATVQCGFLAPDSSCSQVDGYSRIARTRQKKITAAGWFGSSLPDRGTTRELDQTHRHRMSLLDRSKK
jgi:hypothetical protein